MRVSHTLPTVEPRNLQDCPTRETCFRRDEFRPWRFPGPLIAVAIVAVSLIGADAQQRDAVAVAIDGDDIGGIVTSEEGPEAGVWVIAETNDLPTKFIRIVVTDDKGQYVLPDLPKANYAVFVRGYGLIDSTRVAGRPGQRLDFTATLASSPREAAEVFPAAYWLTVMRVPPTGPIHPAELTRAMKTCMACHQLGSKATRALPEDLGAVESHLDAWDRRVQRGPAGATMAAQFARLRGQRTMLSEWTERIAAGAYPLEDPPRPSGIERNLVITLWDWGVPSTFAHNEAASDKRNHRVNANGPIYGPSQFHDTLLWVDPVTHTAGEATIPTTAPPSTGTPSPAFGGEAIWSAAAEPRSAAIDHKGRVWIAARHRAAGQQPAFCTSTTNAFARYFPVERGTKQVSFYDSKTKDFTPIDTCFTADHNDLSPDDKIYFGADSLVGWIDTRAFGEPSSRQTVNHEAVQGWCPGVLDTNGDGRITEGWTEPDQAIDPAKDHRIQFGCYQPGIAPDGSIWCGPGGETNDRIVRLEIGPNPPHSCKAEVYQVPQWRDVSGSRGLDVDSQGVAWVNMAATDHIASFDRRKCKTLNGSTATGPHCPEGWTFYPIPGPPFFNASPGAGADARLQGGLIARTTDLMYLMTVDRFDVLGLNGGKDVPMTELSNSDAVLALLPETGEFVTLRVPYPLGFFGRSLHPRLDDLQTGWKGRGLWSNYASWAGWHVEGSPGVRSKVVKFQMRPTPLAK